MNEENRFKQFKYMLIMLCLIGILFGGIFSYKLYSFYMMKKMMSKNTMPPVAVSAINVAYESWQPNISATGTIKAINGVEVTPEVSGLVKSIKAEAGKNVQAGEILVELNADVEIAQLHALEADTELAEVIFKRDTEQYAFKGVSKTVLDTDAANLKSKKAQVAQQMAIISKKIIRAPFNGTLGIININLGQFLNPGDDIATLQSLDPIYVDFIIPQQEAPKIVKNQNITFKTDIYPSKIFEGKISGMNPKIDIATRTVTVEATLKNFKKELLPGIYGLVNIAVSTPKNYLTVPQTAITYNPYGDFVYILKDEKKDKDGKSIFIAHQKFVTLGEILGDKVQVLKGVAAGDLVVSAGQVKLKNGSPVFVNYKLSLSNKANKLPQNK